MKKQGLKCLKSNISRSAHTNNQYEFQIFATNFLFIYFLNILYKVLRLKYIKKCQYNCRYSKLLPGKNTSKQKFVFRKIGYSHEMNEI